MTSNEPVWKRLLCGIVRLIRLKRMLAIAGAHRQTLKGAIEESRSTTSRCTVEMDVSARASAFVIVSLSS